MKGRCLPGRSVGLLVAAVGVSQTRSENECGCASGSSGGAVLVHLLHMLLQTLSIIHILIKIIANNIPDIR